MAEPTGDDERGVIELTRDLIEDARRRAEQDAKNSPPMRPVSKMVLALAVAATAAAGATS